MAANLKDAGFLLRKIPYSESSFILKAFTREHGLVSFMAKGAKRQNSRLHGLLEPVVHLQFLFPNYARSEIKILADVSLIQDFPSTRENILKQSLAQLFGEVLLRYTPAETDAPEFHDLLLAAQETLEESAPDRNLLQTRFAAFLLEYCRLSGFQPQFRVCVRCGEPVSGASIVFQLDQGGPSCGRCHREEPGPQWLRESVLRWLDAVQDGTEAGALPQLGRADAGRAEEFLLLYLGRHAGGQKLLKSVGVWHALMEES